MKKELPTPVVIIAIIAVVVMSIFIGKSVFYDPPRPSKEEMAKYMPAGIDPVTYKPRSSSTPHTGGPVSGTPSSSQAPAGSPGKH